MICRVVIPSDTLARKAQRILNANGYSAEVVRSSGSKDGCGFALRIRGNCDAARMLLEREGITIRSVRIERDGA